MLAMQYSIALPPGFDAQKIRERVDSRRQLFDQHAGLVHKSFLYNADEQLYAPFYLWEDAGQARDFLLDELFHGVIETFSRHRVRSWFVVSTQHGNRTFRPAYALRETDVIAPEERLDRYLQKEQEAQNIMLANPSLYMHVIAIDADRWEILRFSLWADQSSAISNGSDSTVGYEVMHVSEPLASADAARKSK